jgi:hypothetical protein
MSYIGSNPQTQSFIAGTDYFNGTGSATAFTLSRSVVSVNDIQATVNNVVQVPNDAYTVSGNTITFTSAPSAGTNNVYVRYISTTTQSITPSQGTVSWSTLNSDTQQDLGISFKNRIINGAMIIDQRNAGASVSTSSGISTYTLDRWGTIYAATSKFTVQQNAGSVTPPAGYINYLGVTSSAATTIGSTDYYGLNQKIEGYNIADLAWGTANAKTITVSFWIYSSLTGTFGGSITNSTQSYSYPFSYTINAANTWEQKTITITGPTSGTWLTTNATGLILTFNLGYGSTYSGPAGAWAAAAYYTANSTTNLLATNGATLYVTGVMLEVGTQATTFDYRSYGTELALCQRYYEKSYNIDVVPATNTGDGRVFVTAVYQSAGLIDYGGTIWFKVQKRTNPTLAYWREDGTSNSWNTGTASGSGTLTPITNRVGTSSFNVYATGSGFSNTPYVISGQWTANSEL